ncbi:MAG: putative Ig domain-containing protein [Leptospiraceae bacterium]|nr:putative Ig domain-containing protein [Leptospiraceae bacterium]
MNSSDCSISGTPTTLSSYALYSITASNSNKTKTVEIGITISESGPTALTYSSSSYTFTKNVLITTITPTYTGTITSCTSNPTLPSGLTLNSSNCSISGTPTVASSATYTISASNQYGSTSSTIQISVNDSPPSGLSYSGSPYSYTNGVTITALNPSITGTATAYAVSPAFPTGISINSTTGVISGTPSVASSTTTYTITASNSGGSTSTTIDITVNDTAPSGLSYSGNPFTFTKGTTITSVSPTVTGTPTSYSVSPALPSGLAINTTSGVFSGTPSVLATSSNYTVTATNTGGNTTFTLTITVNDVAPSSLSYSGNPFTFTNGTTITSVSPTVTGNPTSYSIAPSLPAGLSLNTTTGVLSGTPSVTSTATNYTVTATNTGGSTTFTMNITVNIPAPNGFSYSGTPYRFTLSSAIPSLSPIITGSVTSYGVSPSLPSGLSLNTSTGVISGTPSSISGASDYTITATNVSGSTTATINMTVINSLTECSSYATLAGDDRSTTVTGTVLCDISLALNWYRFTGTFVVMPTTAPTDYYCNTHATGYMNFSHPANSGTSFTGPVCFNWSGNSCYLTTTINVSNCGGFYVYKLPASPGCDLRYCTN